MMQRYNYGHSFCNMSMSIRQYVQYNAKQKEIKVSTVCKPISAIRGMDASEILELCRQENSIPVDVTAILKKLGISCLAFDFSKLESQIPECFNGNHILGALATKGDKAAIFYSVDDKRDSHRYRFTIAHEIGHCCLNHIDTNKALPHLMFRKDGEANSKKEIAANIFAGELLIPENSLMSIIDELLIPSVSTLAEIFDVSDKVMLARLKYLKLKKKIVGYNC